MDQENRIAKRYLSRSWHVISGRRSDVYGCDFNHKARCFRMEESVEKL